MTRFGAWATSLRYLRVRQIRFFGDQARSNAQRNVRARYSVIRRAILIAVFGLWLVALILPLIGRFPATTVSLLVSVSAVVIKNQPIKTFRDHGIKAYLYNHQWDDSPPEHSTQAPA